MSLTRTNSPLPEGAKAADAKERRSQRSQTAVAIGATLAGLLSFKIADWMLQVVPQRELLLALTLLLAVLFRAVSVVATDRFYQNDLYIDEFEQFILAVLDFLALLLVFVSVQYAAQFVTDLFTVHGIPLLPTALYCLIVLLFIALSFVPFVRSDLMTNEPETATANEETEEGETDQDSYQLHQRRAAAVGRADD